MEYLFCGALFLLFLLFFFLIPRIRFARNPEEVKEILEAETKRYRIRSYSELTKFTELENIETKEILGRSGKKYQLEVEGLWDSGGKGGNLRVMISISGGGIPHMTPLSGGFIITPKGEFVGEGEEKKKKRHK